MKYPRIWALLIVSLMFVPVFSAHAEEYKPDDSVAFEISAEDWIATKSARVNITVEAAVTGNTAGTMRGAMNKAVGELIKADWKLTSFYRSQDQTGMERWSAMFEARVPENDLNNINENAKKLSKAGMQLSVSSIDFSPTLDEIQAAKGALRTKIYKNANEQLAALNATLVGRDYRISLVEFTGETVDNRSNMRQLMKVGGARAAMMENSAVSSPAAEPPMELAQKITLTARVVLSALPPSKAKQ